MTGATLFTTWMTSTDGLDHAITDEQFHDHRPEPEAVCGAVIMLAPMETLPGPRCPCCVAYLAARRSLRDLDQRLDPHRHRQPSWLARALRAVIPVQRSTSDPGGRGVTPTAAPTGHHHNAGGMA